MLARIKDGRALLVTRNDQVWTARFPELTKAFEAFARPGTVFDGEIVRLKQDGISSFASLQEALSNEETGDLVYYAFDLLFLDGVDLRASALESRKQLLSGALENAPDNIRLSEYRLGGGKEFFEGLHLETRRAHLKTTKFPLFRNPKF
jgi:bifunctional non-homologous end joining protein LigD